MFIGKMTNEKCKTGTGPGDPEWAPKLPQRKLRTLYTRLRLNAIDDEMLLDVGWHLYLRAKDIQKVRRARVEGHVSCPKCGDEVLRTKVDVREESEGNRYAIGWFHCPDCETRLLWRDCRDALRATPTCFACGETLDRVGRKSLRCRCGVTWTWQSYKASVSSRINLPCPTCSRTLHRPSLAPTTSRPKSQSIAALDCPKCGASAVHEMGEIRCVSCGYSRRWRAYRRSLKRRDEQMTCGRCHTAFKWQAWKRSAQQHQVGTGNYEAVASFLDRWPKATGVDEQVARIDMLVQAIHGRGALGPVFIQGTEQGVRTLLDELAEVC